MTNKQWWCSKCGEYVDGHNVTYKEQHAERCAVRDAAYDAALMAIIITCDGLGLSRSHIFHAQRRWAVWTRGYGLLCDINGVPYVYEKP